MDLPFLTLPEGAGPLPAHPGSEKDVIMSELATLLEQSSRKSPYFAKDLAKARKATQFIGQGSARSSTAAYAIAAGPLANTGRYTSHDVVFVSAEGDRAGRMNPVGQGLNGHYKNIDRAIQAGARFILDRVQDRHRPHNVGERQIAGYLLSHGYQETAPSLFSPTLT
jgi:hypothetical protein